MWSLVASSCLPLVACAGSGGPAEGGTRAPGQEPEADNADLIELADAAIEAGDHAQAMVAYRAAATSLGERSPADPARVRALLGLADAAEANHDFASAAAAYGELIVSFPAGEHLAMAHARQGAVLAELGDWSGSAANLATAVELTRGGPASLTIELLARRALALFQMDALDEAEEVARTADAIFRRAEAAGSERFDTFYFVGMARFYVGAIAHRRFRNVAIALPEAKMTAAFEKKLKLLQAAQDAYRDTIRAKHVYWVSAAGFQMGRLFEEFHDDLMHAPVPDWLDERQRRLFYAELKKQLRPIVNKAIWVFEKNMVTARKLGVDNDFIERTEAHLAHLQTVLLEDDATMGQPRERIASTPPKPTPDELKETGRGRGREEGSLLYRPRPTPLPQIAASRPDA